MLRALTVPVGWRRRRAVVALSLAAVVAGAGTWVITRDEGETRVAAGAGQVPSSPADPMSVSPGDLLAVPSESSSTTSPLAPVSSSPSTTGPGTRVTAIPTNTSLTAAPTTTPTTLTDTVIDTVLSPPDPHCGAPLGPGSEAGPRAVGWRTIPAAPIARMRHGAVWTGREMIVWGGSNGDISNDWREFNDGAAYDPATGTWRVLPPAPLKARTMPAMVWTGREVVVVGVGAYDGAAYDPVKNCWRRIADSSLGYSTDMFGVVTATWAGDRVLVWNGVEVGAWDPLTDTWERFAGPPQSNWCTKPGRWAGERLVVWWATDSATCSQESAVGATFDPATKTWVSIPIPQDVDLSYTQVVPGAWTGRELLLAGSSVGDTTSLPTTWFAFDHGTAQWRTVAQPSHHWEAWQTAVWSGAEMILWGTHPGGTSNTTYAYDPVEDHWRDAGRSPFGGRNGQTAVWTGMEMIVWGGQGEKVAYGDGGAYRPS